MKRRKNGLNRTLKLQYTSFISDPLSMRTGRSLEAIETGEMKF